MDCKTKIKELRESTGMNRKEFCKYFQIPYRTVTEWELDNRHAPEYVLRLLEYYIQNEGLAKKKVTDECLELEEKPGMVPFCLNFFTKPCRFRYFATPLTPSLV